MARTCNGSPIAVPMKVHAGGPIDQSSRPNVVLFWIDEEQI